MAPPGHAGPDAPPAAGAARPARRPGPALARRRAVLVAGLGAALGAALLGVVFLAWLQPGVILDLGGRLSACF